MLHHENLIPFYGVSISHDNLAIVTKYIPGGTLRDLLKEKKIPFDLIIKFGMEIASAMVFHFYLKFYCCLNNFISKTIVLFAFQRDSL